MAESACVTESLRLGYVEAAHVFCGDPDLLLWTKRECIRKKTRIKELFFLLKTVQVVSPASSERRLRVDTVGITRRGVSSIYGFLSLWDMFDVLLSTTVGWVTDRCVSQPLLLNSVTIALHGNHHSRQDRSGLNGLSGYTGKHTTVTYPCRCYTHISTAYTVKCAPAGVCKS